MAKKEYKASAKIMGRTFEAKGETIPEAITNLETGVVAGKVILTISIGKKSKERIIPHISAKRLFMTLGMTKEVALANTSKLFEGL